MKKLTTALLCLLMVFSCAFCVNANDVPWESNQDDKTVSVTAYQDENGDVVFKVSGDDATEFIEKILMCNDEAGNSIGYMDFEQKGITARLGNIIDKDHIVRSNEGLTIKKEILEDVGFYNDDCTFTLLAKGFVPVKVENVVISNIKEKNQRLPLLKSELKLEGEVGDVKFGEPVYLKGDNGEYIANHTENLRITDKNGNELDKSLYTLRWARRIVDYADKYGFQDPLDIFSDLCLRDKNNSLLVSTISYDYQNKTYDYSAKFTEGEKYALYVVYQGEYEADNRFSISVSYKDNIYSVRDGIIELHSRHHGINDFSYIDAYSIVIDSIKLESEKEVAKIGNVTYTSLTEAFNNAKNGEEIIVINNIEEEAVASKETNAILNVDGKVLKNTVLNVITNYGTLTIEGESEISGYINNCGTLVINDGGYWTQLINKNKMIINGGSFYTWYGPWVTAESGNVVINDGKFISSLIDADGKEMQPFFTTNGTFEVKGGQFSAYANEKLPYYLADGYCLSKNADGTINVTKATQTAVKEPTVVGNQENLDIIKKTEEFKNVKNVGINVDTKKTLTETETKEIEKKNEDNNFAISYKIPLNLKLTAIKDDGTETNITKLDQEITITLALSDENVKALKGAKEIKVARFHGDEVTLLDAKLEGNILTFKTDRFSTYVVVAYKEAGSPSTPSVTPTPETKPNTTPTGSVTCEESMGSANWIWSESKKACVYKVSNTSVK